MTDEEVLIQENRIKKLCNYWQYILGLGDWRINFEFDRERAHPEDALKLGSKTAANCETIWQYKKAWITFFLPLCAAQTDGALEEIIVHEFIHCITAKLGHSGEPPEELMVTELTDAIIWTRNQPKHPLKEINYDSYEG